MTKLDGGKDLHIAILHLKDIFEELEKYKPIGLTDEE